MPRARRRKGVPASAPGMRAAIYVRLSRETDETTSPERQRAACEALCKARGWDVMAMEEDIDVSGFSRGLDRPGLQRILTRLAELDVIVFFKIDRLAPSTADFAEIMRLAEHRRARVGDGAARPHVVHGPGDGEGDRGLRRAGVRHRRHAGVQRARAPATGGAATPVAGFRTATWSSPTPTGQARSSRSARTRPGQSSGSLSGSSPRIRSCRSSTTSTRRVSRRPATPHARPRASAATPGSGTRRRCAACWAVPSCSARSSRTGSRSCGRTGCPWSTARRSSTRTPGRRSRMSWSAGPTRGGSAGRGRRCCAASCTAESAASACTPSAGATVSFGTGASAL